jgi:ribosome-associated toxin RatA of RatAB toxin-antitoxin module
VPGATISVIINRPTNIVYNVVTDFEKYPEFLAETREVETIHKNAKTAQVEFVIKVIKKIRYTLDYKLTRNKKVVWSFVEGDTFKDCKGSWNLKEIEKGVTEATYHVEVDFGLFVPKKITEMLVGKNLPSLMQSFKDRAESMAN